MQYIIIVQKPNGTVTAIMESGDIATFGSETDAQQCADHQIMCQHYPHQIVALDEL